MGGGGVKSFGVLDCRQTNSEIPPTGLALMGFSRSCPSSLDLLKLVLRGCRGAAGELVLSDPGPAQLGSSLAQARFLEIWNSEDLEIQKFGIQKNKQIQTLKIQIRSAQNVGKVWISRKQILLALFGAIPGHFFHGPKTCGKMHTKFPIFLGGPMGILES